MHSGRERKAEIRKIVDEARSQGRRILTEYESKVLLEAYGIPVTREHLAKNIDETLEFAEKIGFPVVLKICSPDIVHKSEVGGVIVGIETRDELRELYSRLMKKVASERPDAKVSGVLVQELVPKGYEVIVGGIRDPQFGPTVMFGLGGIFVEVLKEVSFRLAPITQSEAWRMIEETKAYKLLEGIRGQKPADLNSLIDVICKVSLMIDEVPEFMEIDINPLVALENGSKAIDARIAIS